MLEKIRQRAAMRDQSITREVGQIAQKFVGGAMHRAHRKRFLHELAHNFRDRETERFGINFMHKRSRFLETFERNFVSLLAMLSSKKFPGREAERPDGDCASGPCEPWKRGRDVNRR